MKKLLQGRLIEILIDGEASLFIWKLEQPQIIQDGQGVSNHYHNQVSWKVLLPWLWQRWKKVKGVTVNGALILRSQTGGYSISLYGDTKSQRCASPTAASKSSLLFPDQIWCGSVFHTLVCRKPLLVSIL